MNSKEINWKNGNILQWDLNFFRSDKEIFNQLDELKEDLVQVQYPNNIILDIGWYPEFDINGKFRIVVVHNYNWDIPIYEVFLNDKSKLLQKISYAIEIAINST